MALLFRHHEATALHPYKCLRATDVNSSITWVSLWSPPMWAFGGSRWDAWWRSMASGGGVEGLTVPHSQKAEGMLFATIGLYL